jgi:hypothetical protein
VQLHVSAIDLKTVQPGPPPVDPDIQAGQVHIPDMSAPAADEVLRRQPQPALIIVIVRNYTRSAERFPEIAGLFLDTAEGACV